MHPDEDGFPPPYLSTGAGSSRERLMPVATGAPRDESVGAGWHGGTRGVTLTPTFSLRERGKALPFRPLDGTTLPFDGLRTGGVAGGYFRTNDGGVCWLPTLHGGGRVSNPPLQRRATRCGVAPGESPSPSPVNRVRGFTLFGKLRAGSTLSRRGRGGKSPLLRSLFSCVTGSRSPGGRATGVCGVDGRAIGVRLAPVLFESFPDPALGGGDLHGCGLVLLFFLVALGGWVLSESGGPGSSVLASLFSGPSSSRPSYSVLGFFGGLLGGNDG